MVKLPDASARRSVKIDGLKIYTQDYLIKKLRLGRGKSLPAYTVIRMINNFYKSKGYSLVRTYVVKDTGRELSLYVDEGRLGKIVFHKMNTLKLVMVRYSFDLKANVFNRNKVRRQMAQLKEKYGLGRLYYRLKRTKDYQESLLQLDREFEIPVFGKAHLPFFKKHARYDMHVYIKKSGRRGTSDEKWGYRYGLKTSYSKGFIPWFSVNKNSLFQKRDHFEAGTSLGIKYGFDFNFTEPPALTFFQADTEYRFAPYLKGYFTPLCRGLFYRSKSSRSDLGIEEYNYILVRGLAAPGITLLKRFRINTGLGVEVVNFDDSRYMEDSDYQVNIEDRTDGLPFVTVEMKYETLYDYIGENLETGIALSYSYYYHNSKFHEFSIDGITRLDLRRRDLYTLRFITSLQGGSVPFHHEFAVSSGYFKGFMGMSYHTNQIGSISNQYLLSLYREFVYIGLYFDMTFFEGSGYDLSGFHQGIAGGPAGEFIFFDQFMFTVYFGRDLLIKELESQWNLSFSLKKKW